MSSSSSRPLLILQLIGLTLLIYIATSMHGNIQSQAGSNTFTSSQKENLDLLITCLESAKSQQQLPSDCKAVAKVIQDILSPTANERPNLVSNPGVDIPPEGCYDLLDVSSGGQPIALDKHDAIGSLTKCGHPPELQSKDVVPVPKDNLRIPNIVHFVWFIVPKREYDISFRQYMSILSAHKFIKPRQIFWHGNYCPQGPMWEKMKREIPNFYFVHWAYPKKIYNWPVGLAIFASDFLRMKVLSVHGGIYLDEDMLVLKSFDPLRDHSYVMSRELRITLINCIILSEPWAPFLRLWTEAYVPLNKNSWTLYNMQNPSLLERLYPHLVHVENNTLTYPSWPHVSKLYTETFDWKKSYSLHIQGDEINGKHHGLLPTSKEAMDKSNATIGEIMRYIYYTPN